MSAANATPNAIKAQAFRLSGKIIGSTTGNPITGGLASLAAQISKDGSAFANTFALPSEIGNTGYFTLDLTASEMTCASAIIRVTASNANAVEFSDYIPVCDLTPTAGRFDAQAVLRVEQAIQGIYYYLMNAQTIAATAQTVSLPAGSTYVSGVVSNDGNGGSVRGELT